MDKPPVDEESGLPAEIMMSANLTPAFVEETKAYNRILREEVRRRLGKP
ncbi:MAG: hypothetical protein HY343_03740 [Lentisphaerae bacterium]|nr:hypothetical protein [Lentisphaerota bacterium]